MYARPVSVGTVSHQHEFLRRLLADYTQHALPTGSESQPGFVIEPGCVYTVADGGSG